MIAAVVVALTAFVFTVNAANVLPAGIVTVAGTVTEESPLVTETGYKRARRDVPEFQN